MPGGYMGKLAFVDLTSGSVGIEMLSDSMAREFIGGYGLGVRMLFERQAKQVDPLGPENILGLTAGPLTGTKAPTGGRYMACCKSPLTGGWGDANAGGYFGSELKAAGFDAVFVSGAAAAPVFIWIADGRIEIRDAGRLWGLDSVDAEDAIQKEFGDKKIRVACIGPASERLSLISGIVNDRGRIAARSGVGAVMGSKKLKAVAVRGHAKVPVADTAGLGRLTKAFAQQIRDLPGMAQALMKHGTCGFTQALVAGGAVWQGRRGTGLAALGAACLVISLAMPGVAREAGFQLSFAAVVAILAYGTALRRRRRAPSRCSTQPGSLLTTADAPDASTTFSLRASSAPERSGWSKAKGPP